MLPSGSFNFINYLRTEDAINSLLTPKHHWDCPTYNGSLHQFRTIFYPFVGEGLEYILDASRFDVYRLDGMNKCYLFEPKNLATAVPLAMPSGSIFNPGAAYNYAMFVSGSVSSTSPGWHGFAVCYPEICRYIDRGRITDLTRLP